MKCPLFKSDNLFCVFAYVLCVQIFGCQFGVICGGSSRNVRESSDICQSCERSERFYQ